MNDNSKNSSIPNRKTGIFCKLCHGYWFFHHQHCNTLQNLPQKEENDSHAKDRICLEATDDTEAHPEWKQGLWLERDMGRNYGSTGGLGCSSRSWQLPGPPGKTPLIPLQKQSFSAITDSLKHISFQFGKEKSTVCTAPLERLLMSVLMLSVHIFSNCPDISPVSLHTSNNCRTQIKGQCFFYRVKGNVCLLLPGLTLTHWIKSLPCLNSLLSHGLPHCFPREGLRLESQEQGFIPKHQLPIL